MSGAVPLEENVDFDVDGWTKLVSGNYHRCSLIGRRVLSRARSHDQASIADLDTMKSDELHGKRKTKVDFLFGMCRHFYHTCTTSQSHATQRIPRKEKRKNTVDRSSSFVDRGLC